MPTLDELEQHWQPLSQAMLHAMQEWRRQHPRATLQEMEQALDPPMARLRAQMLQDMALSSPAADLPALAASDRPKCTACGAVLAAQGQQSRTLVTEYDQPIVLTRSYATCPACGVGLFPPG